MTNDKLVVLLSTYNGERYLGELLSSLAAQDWDAFTLMVRDDGSSDKTLQILKEYQATAKYHIQILPSDAHLGSAQSFFNLLAEADDRFDFYAFCDQDDVWLPGKISAAVNKLKQNPANIPTLYCSRLEYVDENLAHIKWTEVPQQLGVGNALVENIAPGCTIVVGRSGRELILSNPPKICLAHDWWFYLTFSCFGQVLFDDYCGIKYRQHGGNAVGVPTGFADGVIRRVNRFFGSRDGVFRFSDQARVFKDTFGEKIPDGLLRILDLVIFSKSSFRHRLRLAMSKDIWRQRLIDDLILRFLILINQI